MATNIMKMMVMIAAPLWIGFLISKQAIRSHRFIEGLFVTGKHLLMIC
jgi:hypothetical protein